MPKVIETNLSMRNNEIVDHQSRIINVDSWEDFVEEIKDKKTIQREACLGSLQGTTIPRNSRVENLKYDNIHLSCEVYNYANMKTKKLAYLIR